MKILEHIRESTTTAFQDVIGVGLDPLVRPSAQPRFGDYQIDGLLSVAPRLGRAPAELAAEVAGALGLDRAFAPPAVAEPGFINLCLRDEWLAEAVARAAEDPRAGVAAEPSPQTIVIDFSSPNVAKHMHVGHLRSTVIGDALVRTLRFLGHRVVGDNHVGDWGTQFGTLLWAYARHRDEAALARDGVGELERLYRVGTKAAEEDASVAEACRAELVRLQAGDPERLESWRRFVAISETDARRIYDRMAVRFDTWMGESAYNDALPELLETLHRTGIAREHAGAMVVYFDEASGLSETPFLVRKSDGGYLYSTTDIATIEHRLRTYAPDRVVYVVDVRQSLHFRQLFETARRMGVTQRLEHVGFGMMLGPDGKPFKTRSGGTVRLQELLDEAEERALPLVRERWPEASEGDALGIAAQIGVGAVKYADLSHNLETNYKFEWEKMTTFEGNTGPYLQYTVVRARSLLREAERRFGAIPAGAPLRTFSGRDERALGLEIVRFHDVLARVEELLRPHFLCEYLYGLARKFNGFYGNRPVLDAATPDDRDARVTLTRATERVLTAGMECLNLPVPDRM